MNEFPPGASGLSAIEFLKARSLADVVRHEIEALIVNGHFAPNERINELSLAQKLGVSRAPVREACRALAAIGLLDYIPNRGLFVRLLDETELHDVAQARAYALASIACALAERVTDAQVAELSRLVAELEEIARLWDVSAYYPVNLRFHDSLCEMCGNRRMASVYQGFARELHVQRFRALSAGDNLGVSNREHADIVKALSARDPLRAFIAGRAHVLNGFRRIQSDRGIEAANARATSS
ncbi:FCD domain-containing protein [Pseudochelatococcus sp. B33]